MLHKYSIDHFRYIFRSHIWKLTVPAAESSLKSVLGQRTDLYHIGILTGKKGEVLTVVQKTPFKKWVKIFRVQADTLREGKRFFFSAQKILSSSEGSKQHGTHNIQAPF